MNKYIPVVLGLLALAGAWWLGSDMQAQADAKQIWGYQTFFCLILIWLGILGLSMPIISNLPNKNKLVAASSLSGLLLSLGFMFNWAVLALFVGFVPLLWVENEVFKARAQSKTSYWTVFKFAYNTFAIWNICTTYWVPNAGFIPGCIAIFLNSFFMTVPFLAFHFVKKQHNAKLGFIAFVSCWLSFEWGHMYWDLSWPWLTLGNSFAHSTYAVQWYEYTGVFGGGIWILFLNVVIFQQFSDRNGENSPANPLLAWSKPALYIVVPVLLSLFLGYSHNPETGEKREVLLLQPNYEPHFEKFNTSYNETFSNFYQLISQNAKPSTDFIIFPETSFDDINIRDLRQSLAVKDLDTVFSQFPNTQLIVGISALKIYTKGEELPQKVGKVVHKNGEPLYYNSYNSAIWLDKNNKNAAEPLPIYHKSKLVPGSEIMPYVSGITFLSDLIMDLGGTTGYALTTQANRETFATPRGNIAPVICYESIYGDFVAQYIKRGAQVLAVMTNDGWWGDTDGYKQHLDFARLRAIETRRWVVRAANSGSSAIINSKGEVLSKTAYNQRTTLSGEVYLKPEITFFVRYEGLIGRTSLLLTIILLVSAMGKLVSPSKKEVQQLRKDNDM